MGGQDAEANTSVNHAPISGYRSGTWGGRDRSDVRSEGGRGEGGRGRAEGPDLGKALAALVVLVDDLLGREVGVEIDALD